jgi:hypothetical protein
VVEKAKAETLKAEIGNLCPSVFIGGSIDLESRFFL